jgi:hypothetical protein
LINQQMLFYDDIAVQHNVIRKGYRSFRLLPITPFLPVKRQVHGSATGPGFGMFDPVTTGENRMQTEKRLLKQISGVFFAVCDPPDNPHDEWTVAIHCIADRVSVYRHG